MGLTKMEFCLLVEVEEVVVGEKWLLFEVVWSVYQLLVTFWGGRRGWDNKSGFWEKNWLSEGQTVVL